jgi:sortase A
MMINKGPSRLALGTALLITGLILLSRSQEVVVEPSNTFANEPVNIEGFSQNDLQSAPMPERILIPELNIDLGVERSRIIGGYWEVFEDKAGWGEGSGLPGQPGNQVIFAHARENLFLPLRSIELEVMVYVLTDSGWFNYQVTEIKEVNPNQVEVIAPTEDETLTLYTCSGYKDLKRLIVIAKPLF